MITKSELAQKENIPREALLDEVRWNRDVDRVRKCLLEGAHVNATDENKNTPLHIASQNFPRDTVECKLTKEPADPVESEILAIDETWLTRTADIVDLLLQHGADVNGKNEEQWAPLHLAVSGVSGRGSKRPFENSLLEATTETAIRTIELLLSKDAYVNTLGEQGKTPLHLAVESGRIRIVEALLKHEANLDAQDDNGETPLHLAVRENTLDTAEVLLKHGANVNARDYQNGQTPLHLAVRWPTTSIVEMLLSNGADPNVDAKQIGTPLHVAVTNGSTEVARVLLEHGADANAQDRAGRTALFSAVKTDLRGKVRALLEHGANANAQDGAGRTPLFLAVETDSLGQMRELLEHGANVNVAAYNSTTPLHVAVKKAKPSTVKMLLEHGANVEARDHGGETPLHLLAGIKVPRYFKDLMDLLLEHGADLGSLNNNEQTLVHLMFLFVPDFLIEPKFDSELLLGMLNELFSHSPDVNVMDRAGNTPYNIVTRYSHSTLVKFTGSIFVNHIRKLIALRAAHIAEKNRALFFDVMEPSMSWKRFAREHQIDPAEARTGGSDYYEKCAQEVDNLKTVRISKNITLADVLTLGSHRTLAHISRNVDFQKYAQSNDLNRRYPIYAFLIRFQYQRSLEINLLRDECAISLEIMSSGRMNKDCVNEILQYLDRSELKNLSKAASWSNLLHFSM